VKTTFALPLLLTCAATWAETVAPPSEPVEARTWSASMKHKPTTGAVFGSWRIDFEKTTLPQVLSRASVGDIRHAGEAGESIYWLCYTVSGKTPSRIWITAHCEMGGPERAVTGITVTRVKAGQAIAECPALPAKLLPVSLQGSIWVGTREAALVGMLGAPSHRSDGWISYDFEGKKPGNCPGGFDVMNSLLLKTRQGSVEAIYASQVTSC
jgi:hypothetical protein